MQLGLAFIGDVFGPNKYPDTLPVITSLVEALHEDFADDCLPATQQDLDAIAKRRSQYPAPVIDIEPDAWELVEKPDGGRMRLSLLRSNA